MENLIHEVKKHPALYDHRDNNFHDKQHKNNIWAQIANSLNYTSGTQVEEEWEQLVKKFRDTIEMQICVDMEKDQSEERKWKYSQQMEFLLPFLVKKIESDQSNSSILNTIPDQSPNNAIDDQLDKDPNVCGEVVTKIKEEKIVSENIKTEIDIDENELKSTISDPMQAEVKIEETELAISDVMAPATEDELNSYLKCENNDDDIMASNTSLTYNNESSFDEEDDYDEGLETEDEDALTENEQKRDSLYHFFMSMYSTTKRMPEVLQTRIQNKISEALAETDAIMQESGIAENSE